MKRPQSRRAVTLLRRDWFVGALLWLKDVRLDVTLSDFHVKLKRQCGEKRRGEPQVNNYIITIIYDNHSNQ